MKKPIKCSGCKLEKPAKHSKRLNGGLFCADCALKKRHEHREFLKREICGIRKRSDLEKEWIELRKKRESMPLSPNRTYNCFSISKIERQILWKKYCREGLSYEEANKTIKLNLKYLHTLMEELRLKGKAEQDLKVKFNEEFAKLLR
jgi:hypothetical protein